MILAGKVAGKTIGSGIAEELKPSTIVKPGDKGYTETIRSINRSPLPRSDGHGTVYFDFDAGR